MDLYVRRHDGRAVTCDDFVKAMSDFNKIDLTQFMRWYRQAGTPVLDVQSLYDNKAKTLTLTVRQSCKPTPGQPVKKPLHIPFAVGLLDGAGRNMIKTRVLSIKKPREVFIFENIRSKPVLSLLRDFSAPVRLNYATTDNDLLFLLARDSDPFNRWEAGFKLATERLLNPSIDPSSFIDALGDVLRDKKADPSFKAMVLSLPGEGELGLALQAQKKPIDVDFLYAARKAMVKRIAHRLRGDFAHEYKRLTKSVRDTAADGATMGRRELKNLCLSYLAATEHPKILSHVFRQAVKSKNMTDQIAALGILSDKIFFARPRVPRLREKMEESPHHHGQMARGSGGRQTPRRFGGGQTPDAPSRLHV